MAIWPFNRKSKKSAHSVEDPAMPSSRSRPPERAKTEPSQQTHDTGASITGGKLSRKESKKRPRSTSRKLSKTSVPTASDKSEGIPPVPALSEQRRNELNEQGGQNKSNQLMRKPPGDRGDVPSYYFQNSMSNTSLQPEKFSVVREPPTLHNKKFSNDQGLLRRRSSKRKKDDHVREQEIKAMSSPIPIPKRPKSYQTDILARDSRNIRGDLNRNLDRPLSNVSLPLAESLHSQMSNSVDQHAFKVGSFDALAPRPTIRYSGAPQSPSGSVGPSRTSTRKDKHPMIPESDEPPEKSRRRIDDLVDDMDAGSLRELMERDKRRLDQRRKSESERLQRRLRRKAEHQRQQEEAMKREEEAQANPKSTIAIVPQEQSPDSLAAPKREEGTRTPESWLKDPSRENVAAQDPFHDPLVGASTSHFEEATPTEEREEPILGTAKAIRLSSASMTPPLSPSKHTYDSRHIHEPSSLSQYSEVAPSTTPDIPETQEASPSQDPSGGARLSSSWKSIFRRSDTKAKRGSADRGRSDRGRATPSEFSNTSRESVTRQLPPSIPRVPRIRSGTTIRTQSIFREDLPEFPISPPDSRMQSPETIGQTSLPNIPGSQGTDVVGKDEKPLSEIHPAYREEVALSRNASLRARSPDEPQSATLSESLASVDAEGSWLTGKPVKRVSTPQPLRESQRIEDLEESDDDNGLGTPPAERYMGSLTPVAPKRPSEDVAPSIPQRRRPHMAPGTGIGGGSDDEHELVLRPHPVTVPSEEGTTWHQAPGKHPIIVRPLGPGPRIKSREGLLNDFQEAEPSGTTATEEGHGDSSQSPSEHSPSSPEGPFIQRATSVDLGKSHARHISAGSAKLLNLPPRNSMEIKRLSSASMGSTGGEKYPVAQSPRVPEEIETGSEDLD